MNEEHLFSKYELDRILSEGNRNMEVEVQGMKADYILGASIEDLTKNLASKYFIEPIVLLESEIYAEGTEAMVSITSRFDRYDDNGPRFVQGMEIKYVLPFTGNSQLLRSRPSTFTHNSPMAFINRSQLEFRYQNANQDAASVKKSFDADIALIKRYLTWIEANLKNYNDQLQQNIRNAIEARRQKVLKDQGMVAALGVPIRRREDAPTTFSIPVERKTIPISMPKVGNAFVPEPALEMEVYENILTIIQSMVHVMERSPRAFQKMGEEDLRQHFLVQLNGQYQGQASGETFNLEGKTDILIRAADKNIFIAECKIWKGEKSLKSAIDQLLSYTTWRDTKTAILIFNRGKDFSKIVNQIPDILEKHPNFKRKTQFVSESGFRFIMSNKDDANKEVVLTILLFNVPIKD